MNSDFNTITLLHGWARLTNRFEMPKFRRGDTIWGPDNDPEELKLWPIAEKADALEELKKYRCSYDDDGQCTTINEYALCYFEMDEYGDMIQGCDYDTAEGMDEEDENLEPVYIPEPPVVEDYTTGNHKSYRDYYKHGIGGSDIAALTMTGYVQETGVCCKMLKFLRDGYYSAYIVDDAAEIGQHYRFVTQFNGWLKIYDDQELAFSVTGDEINIYRAGEMGCIIQIINNKEVQKMTVRDQMREQGGKLDCCKPIEIMDGRIVVAVLDGNITGMQIDGADVAVTPETIKITAMIANDDYSQYRGYDDTHMLLEAATAERDCCDCPWFDVCALMDEEIEAG